MHVRRLCVDEFLPREFNSLKKNGYPRKFIQQAIRQVQNKTTIEINKDSAENVEGSRKYISGRYIKGTSNKAQTNFTQYNI